MTSPYVVCATAGLGSRGYRVLQHLGSEPGLRFQEASVVASNVALQSFLGRSHIRNEPASITFEPRLLVRLLAGRALTRCRELVLNSLSVTLAASATFQEDSACVGVGMVQQGDRLYAAAWNCSRLGFLDVAAGEGVEQAVAELVQSAASSNRDKYPIAATWHSFEKALRGCGKDSMVLITDCGEILSAAEASSRALPFCIVSGSFNPLHEGHVGMGEAAVALMTARGEPHEPIFELTISNPDKGVVDTDSLLSRCSQFAGRYSVAVTTAPLFTQKVSVLPNSIFVTGMDTAVRVLDTKYYNGDPAQLVAALETLRAAGCRFLVAGRASSAGFSDAEELEAPLSMEEMFITMPRASFECNISSTELRSAGIRVAQR